MKLISPTLLLAAAGALTLCGFCSPAGAQPADTLLPIVFRTGFEAPTYVAGPWVGQDKWTGLPAFPAYQTAKVTKGSGPDGSQAVRIAPGLPIRSSAEWSRAIPYQMSRDLPILKIEWDALLISSKIPSEAWDTTLYDPKGNFMCGLRLTPQGAIFMTEIPEHHRDLIPVPTGAWNHFEMRLNFNASTADFVLNGIPMTPFPIPAPAITPEARIGSIAFGVVNPGFDETYLDNLDIMTMPFVCRPNCDQSVEAPILNVLDFACFQKSFIGALNLPPELQLTSYANFDGSTLAPVLNVNDYMAFMSAFAQGCR